MGRIALMPLRGGPKPLVVQLRECRLATAEQPKFKLAFPSALREIGRPTLPDITAGLTGAISQIPDAMASAVLVGVSPAYGLNAIMVSTPFGALFTSCQKMSIVTTGAMSVATAEVISQWRGDNRVAALAVLTLLVGVFQLILGLMRLGFLTRFISNAVMTGFLTGIGVNIILGQLGDLTGYQSGRLRNLAKTADLITNPRSIDVPTTIVGIGTIVLVIALNRSPLSKLSALLALAFAGSAVWLLRLDSVALVGSLGELPSSLPTPALPELERIPSLIVGAVAVGIVGLIQAAGVSQLYPNSDGSYPSPSRDFAAQGAANIAGGFFRALPTGGSLSASALIANAGGRTRWANVAMALFVAVGVLVFANLLVYIPMPSLAALLILAGFGALRFGAITVVSQTGGQSRIIMMITFAATLVFSIQQAVALGVVAAFIAYVYRSANDIRLRQVLATDDGHYIETEPPETLPSDAVTVLNTYGNVFFAGASALRNELPSATGTHQPVVVLRLRHQDRAGSTFLKVVDDYASELRRAGGALFLSGVSDELMDQMKRTGQLGLLGADHVFPAEAVLHRSTKAAFAAGTAWLAAHSQGKEHDHASK